MKTKLIITAFALLLTTTLANAQDSIPRGQRLLNGKGRGPAYVDVNKNNICDNFENGTPGVPKGQGSTNFRGLGRGQGYGRGRGYGCRQGYGRGQGSIRGRNFADADKNGVCDNFEAPAKK